MTDLISHPGVGRSTVRLPWTIGEIGSRRSATPSAYIYSMAWLCSANLIQTGPSIGPGCAIAEAGRRGINIPGLWAYRGLSDNCRLGYNLLGGSVGNTSCRRKRLIDRRSGVVSVLGDRFV